MMHLLLYLLKYRLENMNKIRISLCFYLISFSCLQAQVQYEGFESVLNPDMWYKKVPEHMAISSDIFKKGKKSIKFFWEPAYHVEGSNASKHSEIEGIYAPIAERESWYSWNVYFPSQDEGSLVNKADTEPMIVTQWHLRGGGTHPPMTVAVKDGKWGFSYKWGKDQVDEKSNGVKFGDLPYNKWTYMVVHVKWSTNTGTGNESLANDGLIEVWKNGKQLLSKKNVPVGFGDSGGKGWPYFKIGIYHYTGKANGRKVIYFDEIKHNYKGTYADVAPGIIK